MTPLPRADTQEGARDVARRALEACPADEAEVVLMGQDASLTRFAENFIHQNVRERNFELRVRAVVDRRVGVASTNDLSPEGVTATARRAANLAAF